MELTTTQALALRMRSLLVTAADGPDSVAGVVEWFGAMQGQDVASVLWSLGVRLPALTLADINAALERREAIRTWPMRGTIHLVPPADAHWMLELMGVRALAGAAKRRETLGLSEQTAERGVEALATALQGTRMTRAECLAAVAATGLTMDGVTGYHLLWYASQKGVTCLAPNVGKEQTFVLLDEWVPKPNRPSRDEALGIVATRFFRSHGPATTADLARWTGLTMKDVKAGVAVAGAALTTVRVDGTEMLAPPELLAGDPTAAAREWAVLPGFDEYILGYKDRSLMLDDAHFEAIVPGGNGIFKSTVVRGGRVVGTWKRTLGKTAVTVEVFPLVPFSAADRKQVEQALQPYGSYLGVPVKVRWP